MDILKIRRKLLIKERVHLVLCLSVRQSDQWTLRMTDIFVPLYARSGRKKRVTFDR